MDARPPELLSLEFTRAVDADDPFAFRFAEQTYRLHRKGGAVESALFPWSHALLADLDALQEPQPDRAAVQRLGDTLRGFLEKLGWAADNERIERARAERRPVHITIRSAAAELYALPWELVSSKSTGQHLGELHRCLVRYEWPDTHTAARSPLGAPPPETGRILFAWSTAGGAIPAEEHLAAIRRASSEGHFHFDEERDVVPRASVASLARALAEPGPPVHVLHILCHGGPAPSQSDSYGLILDAEGAGRGVSTGDAVDAGALRRALDPYAGSLSLVVLAACHGADSSPTGGHLGSVAQALHRVGIPAVVASRYPLSTGGSTALAETLYRRLLVDLDSLEDAFLAARASVSERAEPLGWASLQLYAREADGPDHRPIVFRPYRGLRAFQPADARFHFGRGAEVERLVGALQKGKRLITVVGASGAGKSSLVLAGVVHALKRDGLGGANVDVRVLRPGARPCNALAAALAPGGDPAALCGEIVGRPEALSEAASRALAGSPEGARMLLVIDQLEELLNGGSERAEVSAFIAALLHAVSHMEGRLLAILTLRADFLGLFLDHRALAGPIRESMDIVLPLGEAQIREAIVRPAELTGLRFEEGIFDALALAVRDGGAADLAAADIREAPTPIVSGDLPLLQFALEELWVRRSGALGNCISWDSWRVIGGVRRAIARRADEVLKEHSAKDRPIVRDIFSRLVQLGEGTVDTRRRAPRTELEAIAPGRSGPILERWISARLLTADDTEVGIAHEALIREWDTLRVWINENREALRVRQAVSRGARRWEHAGKKTGDLWRGDRLKRALELQDAGTLTLSATETAFLAEAEADEERARTQAEAESRRVHQLDPRVGGHKRTHAAAILYGLLFVNTIPLLWDGWADRALTNTRIGFTLARGMILVVLVVLFFRWEMLATKVNRRIAATHIATFGALLLEHGVAAALGISAQHAATMDLLLIAVLYTVVSLTSPAYWALVFLFGSAALIAALWPQVLVGIWVVLVPLSVVWSLLVPRYRPSWIAPR